MKHYELLFVVKPTLTEEEVKGKFEFIKTIMQENGCNIEVVKEIGVRKLAYEIDKFERGYYFVIYYLAPPSSIDEILRNLRLTEEIIRFLNIKFEKKKEIAQWEKMAKSFSKKDQEVESAQKETKEQEPKDDSKDEDKDK